MVRLEQPDVTIAGENVFAQSTKQIQEYPMDLCLLFAGTF